jgi:hypothetical protein
LVFDIIRLSSFSPGSSFRSFALVPVGFFDVIDAADIDPVLDSQPVPGAFQYLLHIGLVDGYRKKVDNVVRFVIDKLIMFMCFAHFTVNGKGF